VGLHCRAWVHSSAPQASSLARSGLGLPSKFSLSATVAALSPQQFVPFDIPPLRRWIAPAGQQHSEYLSSRSPKSKCPFVRHRVSRRTRDSVSTARPAVYTIKRQLQHSRALREHCTHHVLGTAPRMAHRPPIGELSGRPSAREEAGRHMAHRQRDHESPIQAHRPSSNAVQEHGRTTSKARARKRRKSRNQGGETEQSPAASGSSPSRKSPG
jgi:hypothetical protein